MTAGVAQQRGGFLAGLFDFSFEHFLTPAVARVVYGLNMAFAALLWLGTSAAAFGASHSLGLFTLVILGPVYALLEILFVRLALEFYVAVIRIAKDVRELQVTRAPWQAPTAP